MHYAGAGISQGFEIIQPGLFYLLFESLCSLY